MITNFRRVWRPTETVRVALVHLEATDRSGTRRGYTGHGQLTVFSTVLIFCLQF